MSLGSRTKSGNPKNDEFYTPKYIFDRIGIPFDLDVAAPRGGANVPADRFYTIEDDGLSQVWQGLVWMNPPFSNATPWVNKFMDHAYGIALLPTSKAKWFKNVWENADAILMVESNFKFDRPDSQRSDIFMPTVLVAMGNKPVAALKASGLGRVR